RDRHLRAALAATESDAVDVRTLAALAAARVASRSMLADLEALSEQQQEAVDAARSAHDSARRAVRGLDRLAVAHEMRVRVEELRVEQHELDEIALRRGSEVPERRLSRSSPPRRRRASPHPLRAVAAVRRRASRTRSENRSRSAPTPPQPPKSQARNGTPPRHRPIPPRRRARPPRTQLR